MKLAVGLVACLALLSAFPSVGAVPPDALVPACGDSPVHEYVAMPTLSPRLVASAGCDDDADRVRGVGGAFLPADHHGRSVCLADDIASDATFYVARDGDGDGVFTQESQDDAWVGPFIGCTRIDFEPGMDGGWWIILGDNAFSGHIVSRSG